VYAFGAMAFGLKVGKVGPNSNARYTSQHYLVGSAPSTLAASLVASPPEDQGFDPAQAGAWDATSAPAVSTSSSSGPT